jgi:glycosyltransferase involved in cell wall biosynthesis
LNKGVDFIIATDNGSTDGTREIFEEYAKKGVLHLIDENNQNHFQSKWVNRMGEIAYKKYKADIILHCDADEFWVPQSGNLKTEIWNSPEDILYVNLAHVLLEYDEGKESFPKNTKWAVINPIVAANPAEESKKQNYYLLKNPPRLIFKTRGKLYKVGEGNDSITNGDDRMIFSDDIIIYHFPLRNKEQFFNKIPLAGAALTSNKKFKERVGWHWRRWYQSYLKGNLEKEYLKLVITREEAVKLEETGVVTEIDFNDLTKNLIPSKAGHK